MYHQVPDLKRHYAYAHHYVMKFSRYILKVVEPLSRVPEVKETLFLSMVHNF